MPPAGQRKSPSSPHGLAETQPASAAWARPIEARRFSPLHFYNRSCAFGAASFVRLKIGSTVSRYGFLRNLDSSMIKDIGMSGLRILFDVSETPSGVRSNGVRSGSRYGCAPWRRGLALAGLVLTFSGSVQAADLNAAPFTKAPPPVAASSWTGFYAGLGLGFRTTADDLTTTSILFNGAPEDLSGAAVTQPFSGTAFRANPYAGYNWQVAPRWVVGIEGDVGFGDRTTTLQGFNSSPAFGFSGGAADSLSVKTTWDASLRARIGYLFTPSTLLYATGGAAWQHDEVTSNCLSLGFACFENGATPAVVT